MRLDEIRALVTEREAAAVARGELARHVISAPAEFRSEPAAGDGLVFTGHAAVFDRLSVDLGGFRERIKRGAFRKVLDGNADVVALIQHNHAMILGRTKSNTLELREDPRGLYAHITAGDTTYARDLRVCVDRGDVDSMSFGFTVSEGGDEWVMRDGQVIRTIHEIGELFDVSVVTFPAYPHTDVRSADGTPLGGGGGEELRDAVAEPSDTPPPGDDPEMGTRDATASMGAASYRRRTHLITLRRV